MIYNERRKRTIEHQAIGLRHSALLPASEVSAYKRLCPFCGEGMLLVRRDDMNGKLKRQDRCTSCGQAVKYLDDKINEELLEP